MTVGEYLVHTSSIRDLCWMDQTTILTLSVSASVNGKVNNEISKVYVTLFKKRFVYAEYHPKLYKSGNELIN